MFVLIHVRESGGHRLYVCSMGAACFSMGRSAGGFYLVTPVGPGLFCSISFLRQPPLTEGDGAVKLLTLPPSWKRTVTDVRPYIRLFPGSWETERAQLGRRMGEEGKETNTSL